MKVGIIGSGGREHALCEALSKSKKISKNKDNRNWIVPFEKWPMLYRCFIILRGEINQF